MLAESPMNDTNDVFVWDLEERILRCAKTAFANLGFEGTSIRHIAAVADTTPRLVLQHCGRKERMLEEIVRAALGNLRRDAEISRKKTFEARLLGFFAGHERFCQWDPDGATILVRTTLHPSFYGLAAAALRHAWLDTLAVDILEKGLASQQLVLRADLDVARAADILLSTGEILMIRTLQARQTGARAALDAGMAAELVLHHLRPRT